METHWKMPRIKFEPYILLYAHPIYPGVNDFDSWKTLFQQLADDGRLPRHAVTVLLNTLQAVIGATNGQYRSWDAVKLELDPELFKLAEALSFSEQPQELYNNYIAVVAAASQSILAVDNPNYARAAANLTTA